MFKNSVLFILSTLIFISCSIEKKRGIVATRTTTNSIKKSANEVIDHWHEAAAEANYDAYFNLMAKTGVFIGTDATENWQNDAFRTFSKPYFDKGKAWHFKPLERNVYVSKEKHIVWFDELLETQMKICRGSGVLVRENNHWKIAHYVLSITIPNDQVKAVVDLKKSSDDLLIAKKSVEKKNND